MRLHKLHLHGLVVALLITAIVMGSSYVREKIVAFSCSGFGEVDSLVFDGHCYLSFENENTNQASAASACVALGGHLPVMTDADETDAVSDITASGSWLGTDDVDGADGGSGATFTWSTAEPTIYQTWNGPSPNDADGSEDGDEDCIRMSSDGLWSDEDCSDAFDFYLCECEGACDSVCGNGTVDDGEECDDDDTDNGDGCSATCEVEDGYECDEDEPSACNLICSNGEEDLGEECDDGNVLNGDGCTSTCTLECSDGVMDLVSSDSAGYTESCDDGNLLNGDGCSDECRNECSDGVVDDDDGDSESYTEECDDGNTLNSDGCSSLCTVERYFECSGEPTTCRNSHGGTSNKQTPDKRKKPAPSAPKPLTKAAAPDPEAEYEEAIALLSKPMKPAQIQAVLAQIDWPPCSQGRKRAGLVHYVNPTPETRGEVFGYVGERICTGSLEMHPVFHDFDERAAWAPAVRRLAKSRILLNALNEKGEPKNVFEGDRPPSILELSWFIAQLRRGGFLDWNS